MAKNYILSCCALLLATASYGQVSTDSLKQVWDRQHEIKTDKTKYSLAQENPFDRVIPTKANKELQVFLLSYTQAVVQNFSPENDLLKGQIVGRLFGGNTTTTNNGKIAKYFEQRALPFFVYQPKIFDGRATLRAAFEIDWTWGDVSYGVGGNTGAAFSADQVNIQTQNLEFEYRITPSWAVNAGLMRLYDTPHDTYRTGFDKFISTGYRLGYWGSDAAGISVRKDADMYKIKAGWYKLYENNVELIDDVTLYELNGQLTVNDLWNVGGSVYYLSDNSNGRGGVSILGQGFRSNLNGYNGTYQFPLSPDPYRANVFWLGSFFSRNEDFMRDRFMITGFVNSNLGAIKQSNNGGPYKKTVDIEGLAANARIGYRYGQTTLDAITADFIYSSANKNGISDGKYTGVLTGNTWGSPGAVFIGHGGYLIFPHGNVVNRYVAAVPDLSNMGFGVTGGTLNFSKDIIPNKLSGKIGGAWAMANQNPNGGGNFIGWEANTKWVYNLGAYFSIELHAAYMGLGDFYNSKETNGNVENRPDDPWTAFIGCRWLIF